MLYYFIQVKNDVIALIFNPTRERCAYLKFILISIDKKGENTNEHKENI
jgi:hypothetical protein